MEDNIEELEKKFFDIIKKDYNNSSKILHAYEFAKKAHEGQFRDSGDPYIIHPISVAIILTEYGLDEPAIEAALLHDVVEDTPVTSKQLKDEFGAEVEELVQGVTKIGGIKKLVGGENPDATNLRRMFVQMANDIRVVLVKLADRLHNMRTLKYLSPERQQKIARETSEIYVPLAERLGLCSMRGELEDYCIMYLDPVGYKDLEQRFMKHYEKHKTLVKEIEAELKQILTNLKIEGEVYGRFKHYSSVYKKMRKKGTEKIYDIIAHRVIVDNIKDCYAVLGAIHNHWKPIEGLFKDYIANPKANGYQSLHTTLMSPAGVPFEVQIRTHEMHKTCEYGIAAHWRYKDGVAKSSEYEEKLDSIKHMVESSNHLKDSKDFVNALKMDFGTGEIWVFTPRKKAISLPENSTPIDFAYAVHTSLGHNCIGAKVNGKIVSLATPLETGDVVEIITSGHDKAPSRDWLTMVRSSGARSKIRAYFRTEMKEENIKRGKEILEIDTKNRGLSYDALATQDALDAIFKTYSFSSEDDMFASVGCGSLTANQIIGRMIAIKVAKDKQEKQSIIPHNQTPKQISSTNQGILVYGEDDVLVHLCKSCAPVPGDEIVGYSVGRGITVHQKGCPCTRNLPKERLVDVAWIDKNEGSTYNANLSLKIDDNALVLTSVITALSSKKIYINSVSARTTPNTYSIVDISLQVKDKNSTQEIINKISELPGVIEVRRK